MRIEREGNFVLLLEHVPQSARHTQCEVVEGGGGGVEALHCSEVLPKRFRLVSDVRLRTCTAASVGWSASCDQRAEGGWRQTEGGRRLKVDRSLDTRATQKATHRQSPTI